MDTGAEAQRDDVCVVAATGSATFRGSGVFDTAMLLLGSLLVAFSEAGFEPEQAERNSVTEINVDRRIEPLRFAKRYADYNFR